MKKRIYFISLFSSFLLFLGILLFFPIYTTKHLIFYYAIHPFDICIEKSYLWKLIKLLFFIFYILSSIIISNSIYSIKLNKKERRLAIKSALTTKVNESKLIVLDSFELDEIKTKKFVAVMNNLKAEKALVVLNKKNDNVIKSANNVPTVKTALTNTINVYDILKYDTHLY